MKQETNLVQSSRGRRVLVVGQVVSDKMQKTISVEVFRLIRHKKYGKYLKKSSVFKAHDEKNEAKVGDTVEIFESVPLSKTKRWKLSKIIQRSAIKGDL